MILNAVVLILCSFITAAGSVWAVKLSRKVEAVHTLVNSQHDEILDTVSSLQDQLATAKTLPAEGKP